MIVLLTKATPTIRRLGCGQLLTPRFYSKGAPDIPWAADNDAFGAWDVGRYLTMLGKIAGREGCLFVVAPDVVADASETMRRFVRWESVIHECRLPVAYALQDGIETVGVPWNLCEAVFIGGTTGFKFSASATRIVADAKDRGKWVHMGRVNSLRRVEYASAIGCDSIDGTSMAMFTDTHAPRFIRAATAKQEMLGGSP